MNLWGVVFIGLVLVLMFGLMTCDGGDMDLSGLFDEEDDDDRPRSFL